MARRMPPGSINPKITKFAKEHNLTRKAAGMGLYMLKDDFLQMDEHVYKPELPVTTLWRVEHLLGVLKTCEKVGLL